MPIYRAATTPRALFNLLFALTTGASGETIALASLGAGTMVAAYRTSRCGIAIYDDYVEVRGFIRTRRFCREDVSGAGDAPGSLGNPSIRVAGVRRKDGRRFAPMMLVVDDVSGHPDTLLGELDAAIKLWLRTGPQTQG